MRPKGEIHLKLTITMALALCVGAAQAREYPPPPGELGDELPRATAGDAPVDQWEIFDGLQQISLAVKTEDGALMSISCSYDDDWDEANWGTNVEPIRYWAYARINFGNITYSWYEFSTSSVGHIARNLVAKERTSESMFLRTDEGFSIPLPAAGFRERWEEFIAACLLLPE